MLIGLAGGVAVLGLAALLLARSERKGAIGWLLPACTVLFVGSIVGTFVVSVTRWTPPIATVRSLSPTSPTHASLTQVLALVRASNRLTAVPSDVDPPPSSAVLRPSTNWGGTRAGDCGASLDASTVPACVFGDVRAARTIVLYGDSHAEMWFTALDDIAIRDDWKLVLLAKGACPASDVLGHLVSGVAGEQRACAAWHPYVFSRINNLHPALLVVTQEAYKQPDGTPYTQAQWTQALTGTLRRLHAGRTVVLGNIPASPGPGCLIQRTIRQCSTKRVGPGSRFIPAERDAARAAGATYVNVTPWFCATRCSPVIGPYDVYFDPSHVALGYTEYLEGVLGQALGI